MKIFALVSKNECCTSWKTSFFAADYQVNDKMVAPDWANWCKDDNAPYLTDAQELKQSLEDEGESSKMINGKYVVVDHRSGTPYTCFDHENDAIRYLWDCYHGDWYFETFTQEEAGEWLQKQTSLRKMYADYVTDYVLDEDNDLEDIQEFYTYISYNTAVGSKAYNLAGLAILGCTWF